MNVAQKDSGGLAPSPSRPPARVMLVDRDAAPQPWLAGVLRPLNRGPVTRDAGVHPRLANLFCTVADEFVTNSVYNAPRDREGKSRFAHLSRTQEVVLAPGEEALVKLCCDGRRLGISVTDSFGSLTREKT